MTKPLPLPTTHRLPFGLHSVLKKPHWLDCNAKVQWLRTGAFLCWFGVPINSNARSFSALVMRDMRGRWRCTTGRQSE